jgi:uncharacterized membrane protein
MALTLSSRSPSAPSLAALLIAACGCSTSLAQTASFTELPPLGSAFGATALGISKNGQFVAGTSIGTAPLLNATVWDASNTPSSPGFTPTVFLSSATSVNDSGSRVTGNRDGEAIVWGGNGYGGDALFGTGEMLDIDPDGSVSVGTLEGPPSQGIRFAEPFNIQTLLPLPNHDGTEARSIDTDSQETRWIVGSSSRPFGPSFRRTATRWSISSGPVALANALADNVATGVSRNGQIVVGFTADAPGDNTQIVRWSGTTPRILGTGIAYDVSRDGQVLVGSAGDVAIIWDSINGIRSLRDVLVAQGVNLTDITLTNATGISGDGTIIVGSAFTQGRSIAFKAVVPRDPCARADVNTDGTVDFFDYLDFVAAFDSNDLSADFNNDDTIDFFDYLDFVAAFDQCA